MKTDQKGSALTVVLVILVVVLAGVAGYFGFVKKPHTEYGQTPVPVTSDSTKPADGAAAGQSATGPKLTVAGMQQYTDSDFGFSFWYPAGMQVTKDTAQEFPDENIKNATVVANLKIGDTIHIEEVHSTTRTMTDTIKSFGSVTYAFDTNLHSWMTSSESYLDGKNTSTSLAKANIAENTMGGLHMFPGVFPYNTIIVPLSANNFVVIDDENELVETAFFARTILALDPAVAVPVSAALQTKTIQTEGNVFAMQKVQSDTGMHTFSDLIHGFSFQYPTGVRNGYAHLGWVPSVFVTQNKTNIDAQGCYMSYDGAFDPNGSHGTQKNINGISYCLAKSSDAGAGQLGTEYYYTTYKNGSYITISYQVMSTNGCGAYDDGSADKQACEAGQKTYDADIVKPIEQSVASLKFTN